MDNKKTYSIVINGISESVKQVDALNDALQFLDQKIKNLESRTVNVSSNSSGASSKVQEYHTEDQLLKNIAKTEQEIVNVRREEYQQLLADKDLLKEAKKLQDQRAASERIAAKNYANTMEGIKQELSDVKRIMQSTDLGSEEFGKLTKRANELNSKLLEVEKTYGQFGRNVGNYPDTMAQGFSKFKIEVNGTIREFDNARQALKELTNERNTLKLMGEDFGNLDEVVKTLKSDIKDMEMSSATMDNLLDSMQGLIALGSTAEGFAALFGFDNKAIEETIKKLVALQNILQGIETIKKQMQTGEGIGGLFAKGNAAIDKFSASLIGVKTNAKAAKKGLTEAAAANVAVTTTAGAATLAVKALSFALKTVGIGIALAAVAFLVEGLQSLIEWLTKADDAAEKAKKVNEECAKSYAEAKSKLTQYSEKVKNFNGTKQQEKKLVEELNNQFGKELGTYKTLAEWQKVLKERGDAYCDSMLNQARAQAALNAVTEAYINLQQVQANIASGEYHHWYRTAASDRAADAEALAEANKKIEVAEKEYRRIVSESEEFDKKHSLGNYAPQIETTKKTGASMTKTIKDVEADIYKAKVDAMKAGLVKTLAQLELERNKRIAEAKKSGKLVQEQIKQINNTYQEKIFEARVQYHINLLNEERSYQDKLKKVQQDTYQAEIDYVKKLNNLRFEKNISGITSQDSIDLLTIDYNSSDVKKYLGNYKKDVVAAYINTKNTINIITKALSGVGDKYDELSDEGKKIFDKYTSILKEAQEQLRLIEEENNGIGQFIEKNVKIVSQSLDEAYVLRNQARKMYYDKILKYTKAAADKELEIEKDKLEAELKINEDAEKERHKLAASRIYDTSGLSPDDQTRYSKPRNYYNKYKESYDSGELAGMSTDKIGTYFSNNRKEMNKWLDEMTEDLKKFNGDGKYTWAEYNEIMNSEAMKGYQKMKTDYENYLKLYNKMSAENKAKNKDAMASWTQAMNNAYVEYLEKVRDEQITHNNKMKVLQNNFETSTEEAERESLKKKQAATTDYYSNLISENENALSSINSKIDKAESVNPLGIINYKATKRNLNELKGTVKIVLDDIANEKEQLLEKLKKGEISFGDYDTLISQLKTIETQAQETGTNVKQKLQNLFGDSMQSLMPYIQEIGQTITSIMSSISEITTNEFNKEIEAVENQIDKYAKLLDKQKEITQKYANDVNSIEDELKTARGDRRQQLIDNLNAEMAAQRASLAEEKRIEKEQEKLDRKKAELEYERDYAEWESNMWQAAINASMAVSMAAVNKWPIPAIPMMSLAAAVGAAQIAAVNSNKPTKKYASGGVIDGNSHAQGGVKAVVGTSPIELEGNEFIIRKSTATQNINLLDYINRSERKLNLSDFIDFYSSNKVRSNVQSVKSKFAEGGSIPMLRNDISLSNGLLTAFEEYSNRPVVVSVVDINDRQADVNKVKVLSGLNP